MTGMEREKGGKRDFRIISFVGMMEDRFASVVRFFIHNFRGREEKTPRRKDVAAAVDHFALYLFGGGKGGGKGKEGASRSR